MIHPKIRREIAERYHRMLRDDIRAYLKGRGIPSTIIERQLLGWNGERITIPIFGSEREVLGFRYAKSPHDTGDAPAMLSDIELDVEFYGWETLARHPRRVIIAANEFDRLVLEANGFPAVASTAGAGMFAKKWLPCFEPVRHVYICLARDLYGSAAARRIQRLMPRGRIVTLPAEVGANVPSPTFSSDSGARRSILRCYSRLPKAPPATFRMKRHQRSRSSGRSTSLSAAALIV